MADIMFVEATYGKEVKLSKEALKFISKYKTLGLFASVQFVKLETVKNQLKDAGIRAIVTKAKRASAEGQILGCDCFEDAFKDKSVFKADALLYVGDGLFHPKALLLAQNDFEESERKDVVVFNPLANSVSILTYKDIGAQHKKYRANMLKYMHAKKVGILVSMKTGQQHLNAALKLKQKGKKEFYLFVGDVLGVNELENFNFIDAWVNTACPRIGFDDIMNTREPIINIKDALEIENAK